MLTCHERLVVRVSPDCRDVSESGSPKRKLWTNQVRRYHDGMYLLTMIFYIAFAEATPCYSLPISLPSAQRIQ